MKEYYEDDRMMIPDFIERMTKDELEAFIAKKEKEIRDSKHLTEYKSAKKVAG